jgi:hypothetical protein
VGVVPDVVVTVRVEVPAPVIEVGLKVPVDPAGKEAMVKGTLPVNPLSAVTVTVYVVLPPTVTVWLAGVTVIEKSVMLSVTPAAVRIRGALVPVTVRVELAAEVVLEVVTVMVEVPAPVMVAGLKLAVAPAGKPETVGVTVPLKPFTAVVVTVYVVLLPAVIVCVDSVIVIVNSTTFSLTVAECGIEPLVPVIVSVELAAGVVPVVVTVNVDVPVLPMMLVGLKLAVAPVGKPEIASATSPVNPFATALVTV